MGEIGLKIKIHNFGRWHPHILESVRPTTHLLTHSTSVILSKNSMGKKWIQIRLKIKKLAFWMLVTFGFILNHFISEIIRSMSNHSEKQIYKMYH